MDFYIYNTMSREKEKFIPSNKNYVSVYACGPTVHNYAHIGNLRKYLMDDCLVKSLRYLGYNVKHAMNITDVGHLQSDSDEGMDKMALSIEREKKKAEEISAFYEDAFLKDCASLNITKPNIICRATEHITDMINLIKVLEEKGYTYFSGGNVYFDTSKLENYEKLRGTVNNSNEKVSRVEDDINKKNKTDFVLWFTKSKFENHVLLWDSPWGTGYPGWHIECSAMAIKYLGDYLDIHTGGIDHIPIHHTNEIAQSESALGHKWVNYWVHSEFLLTDGKKMSKSSGEFLALHKLIEMGFEPIVYRFFCLNSNYRKQLLFTDESLANAKTAYYKLLESIDRIKKLAQDVTADFTPNCEPYINKFKEFLCNDLNTPNAISLLYDLIKDDNITPNEKLLLLSNFDQVLSLDLLKDREPKNIPVSESLEKTVENLILQRANARANKDFKQADEIRNKLLDMKVELIDTKTETTWKYLG